MKKIYSLFLVIFNCWILSVGAQTTTVFFQGFENTSLTCTENWGYSGGVRNNETARTGSYSARVGRNNESNTITFNTVDIAGLSGVVLQIYHRVRSGSGPGMDTREGAVIQVQLNGGPSWTTIGQVGGFGDHNYDFSTSPGGSASVSSGCNVYQCPNPLNYNVPAGTNTIALRVLSVVGGSSCTTFNTNMTTPTAGNYDRTDEGFFIDDVRITTTSTFIPGIWTGLVSTDWFDCNNWHNRIVPTSTTNVTINQSASNNCVVGGSGAAVCNNLTLSSNSATNRNLTIQNTATLTASGNVTINKSAGSGNLVLELLNSAQLTCQNITLQGTGASSENGILRIESANAQATVNGNLTIQTGGNLDMSNGSFGTPEGNLYLHGNWNNTEPETSFKQGESTVRLVGSGNQTIDVGGASPERFWNLIINKTGGQVTLNDNIEVGGSSADPIANRNGVLTLTNGNVVTGSNYLYVTNPATGGISGGSSNSFVDGNLRRHTNSANLYDFPVGEGSRYMRAGVRTTNALENVIEVNANNTGYGTYTPLEPLPNGLVDVSTNRWWDVTKISGITPVSVRLYWIALADDGIVDATKLVVAHWSDRDHSGNLSTLQWWNRGRNASNSTGTIANGYVESSETMINYSPFTFGTTDPINPLPVELISFTGICEQGTKTLRWATASETNNAFFSIQRSVDGVTFDEVGRIPGAGNSNTLQQYQYQDMDKSAGGLYYQLVQTDFNGTSESFTPIYVDCNSQTTLTDQAELVAVTANQVIVSTQVNEPSSLSLTLIDMSGRTLFVGNREVPAGIGTLSLDVNTLPSGIYLLNLHTNTFSKTLRFFIP